MLKLKAKYVIAIIIILLNLAALIVGMFLPLDKYCGDYDGNLLIWVRPVCVGLFIAEIVVLFLLANIHGWPNPEMHPLLAKQILSYEEVKQVKEILQWNKAYKKAGK